MPTYSKQSYLRGWKHALSVAPGTIFTTGFNWWPETREEILRRFRKQLFERINRQTPGFGVGRKWSAEWQNETYRAAAELNYPRRAIHWLPAWLKPRFERRISEY